MSRSYKADHDWHRPHWRMIPYGWRFFNKRNHEHTPAMRGWVRSKAMREIKDEVAVLTASRLPTWRRCATV